MVVHVAAELLPSTLRVVAVRLDAGKEPMFVAAITVDPEADSATDELRQFRRQHNLPKALRLIYWPKAGDSGVTPIEERPTGREAAVPRTLSVRERAHVLVRAGFLIARVILPHHALAAVAMQYQAALAVVASLQPTCGCLGYSRRGHASHVASYLVWPESAPSTGEGLTLKAKLLQRYRFAASLAPHFRALVATAPVSGRIVVCGALSNLRAAIEPLVEELNQEIDVLDRAVAGLRILPAELQTPSLAAWQMVWTVAKAK